MAIDRANAWHYWNSQRRSASGVSYSAEAKTVFGFMSGLVKEEKDAMAKFIDNCVTYGNWTTKLDDFACVKLQLESNALVKWISGSSMTKVNAPTWTKGRDYLFNGTTQYIKTGIDFSLATNYSKNDACFFVHIDENFEAGSTVTYAGSIVGTSKAMVRLFSSTQWKPGLNDADSVVTFANAGIDELIYLKRSDSTKSTIQSYNAGLLRSANIVKSSTGVPNIEVYWGAGNISGASEHTNARQSVIGYGAELTDVVRFEQDLRILISELEAI